MSTRLVFDGSKRKTRTRLRNERRVRAVNARLNQIKALAALLQTEDELDLYLRQIPDDALRAETKNLIQPFCRFAFRQIVLADAPLGAKPTVWHHRMSEDVH